MFNTVILLVLRGSVTQGIEQRHCRHKNDKITVLAILVIYRANNFYLPSYLMASNNNIQQELLRNTPYVHCATNIFYLNITSTTQWHSIQRCNFQFQV